MTSDGFTIRSLEAFCYRYPLATPVVTSFGRMLNRPAVFIRAVDEDGVEGGARPGRIFRRPAQSIARGLSMRFSRPVSPGAGSTVQLKPSKR